MHGSNVRSYLWSDSSSGNSFRSVRDENLAAHRLKTILKHLGTEDSSAFLHRCGLAGSDPTQVRSRLGLSLSSEVASLKNSAKKLTLLKNSCPLEPPQQQPPFFGLFVGVSQEAIASLRNRLPKANTALVSPSCWDSLVNDIAVELCFLAELVLAEELRIWNADPSRRITGIQNRLAQYSGPAMHTQFINEILHDGGERLFSAYPELSRILQRRIDFRTSSLTQFLHSLHTDRSLLKSYFNVPTDAALSSLLLNLSDSHHGGKTVAIATFEDGSKAVLKPRQLITDSCYYHITRFLNDSAHASLFKAVKVLSRKSYGWAEYIPYQMIDTSDVASDFYKRTGVLLALLHALRATDMHNENVIAHAGYPVPIDLETLLHQNYEHINWSGATTERREQQRCGVTRVGLLPCAISEDNPIDVSVLGSALSEQFGRVSVLEPSLAYHREQTIRYECSKPVSSEVDISPTEVLNQVSAGFEEGYALILSHRKTLMTRPDLFPSLKRASVRFVARPTKLYGALIRQSLNPTSLRSSIDRSIEYERLFRSSFQQNNSAEWATIALEELRAVEQLDVPHFETKVTRKGLFAGNRRVAPALFSDTPWRLFTQNIAKLSKRSCKEQLHLIHLSFAQRFAVSPRSVAGKTKVVSGRMPKRLELSKLVKAKVVELGDELLARQADSRQVGSRWVTLEPVGKSACLRIQSAGGSLYSGVTGIALAFSALGAEFGMRRFSQAAKFILEKLLSENHRADRSKSRDLSLAGGVAGLAYVCARSGVFLGDGALIAEAESILLSIPEAQLEGVVEPDVIAGLAGILSVMDAVYTLRPSISLLHKIAFVSERLIQRALTTSHGSLEWKLANGETLVGFAHGSAGIGAALCRAARRLKSASVEKAAIAALANERVYFNEEVGNWPDMRNNELHNFAAPSWCHGATGIALSYAFAPHIASTDRSEAEARAFKLIRSEAEREDVVQSLCCGEAGFLDFLTVCEKSPERQNLLTSLLRRICLQRNHQYFATVASKVSLPGLFVGNAGLAYQLLRCVSPKSVSSILLSE